MRKILLIGPRFDPQHAGFVRAAAIAERASAAVELLDVVYDPHLEGYLGEEIYRSLRERLVAGREARAKEQAAALAARGIPATAKAVWSETLHLAVARAAAAEDVDLVVLEPEDRDRGLSHAEWTVVSTCPAPVLVARGGPHSCYTSVIAAVDPDRAHDKPASLDARIVEHAREFRDLFGVKIEILHCVPPLAPLVREMIAESALRDAESAMRAECSAALHALARDAGLPADAVTVVEGRPADVLDERSSRDEASLVVLGTVSRAPIARLLIGSTAARVLRGRGGDVLVVKPPGFGFAPDENA